MLSHASRVVVQVMLYAEGFSGAKDLASKMVSLFLLSRQLLSQQQVGRVWMHPPMLVLKWYNCAVVAETLTFFCGAWQHYDWGLRAMKTCLNTGGKLVQEIKQRGTALTRELEYETLIKAIRVNTLSKLTFDDAVRFLALLGDVFPGIRSEGTVHVSRASVPRHGDD